MERDNRVGNRYRNRVASRHDVCKLVEPTIFYATAVHKAQRTVFPEWNPNTDNVLLEFGVISRSRLLFAEEDNL